MREFIKRNYQRNQTTRQFYLTPRVLELGFGYLSSLDLTEVAQQAMEQLSAAVDENML